MEGTKGEVIICQNIQRQNCLLRKKKKDEQTNSLEFLHRFLNSYNSCTHTASLASVLPHGTVSKPSHQEAMILDKWVNFIII